MVPVEVVVVRTQMQAGALLMVVVVGETSSGSQQGHCLPNRQAVSQKRLASIKAGPTPPEGGPALIDLPAQYESTNEVVLVLFRLHPCYPRPL